MKRLVIPILTIGMILCFIIIASSVSLIPAVKDDPYGGDRTTGNPADGIGAAAAKQNQKNMKLNNSKFSDWSKK